MSEILLEAVLILDTVNDSSFETFFSTRSKSLLPIVGQKSLLDANLEFIVNVNNIRRIFLICTCHREEIAHYLDNSKWRQDSSLALEIVIYNFPFSRSIGDLIQELKQKRLFKSAFLLMTATGVVSNLSLNQNINRHFEMSKLDNEILMTVLCASNLENLGQNKRSRKQLFIEIDSERRILKYDRRLMNIR